MAVQKLTLAKSIICMLLIVGLGALVITAFVINPGTAAKVTGLFLLGLICLGIMAGITAFFYFDVFQEGKK